MTKQRVLIIDDDPGWLRIIADWLGAEGYRVFRAEGGAEGLHLATEKAPDLILLDIVMRDVDGWEVLEQIKIRNIATRVVMMTAYHSSLRDAIQFIKAGACDYALKETLTSQELIDLVKRALSLDSTLNRRLLNEIPIVNKALIAAANEDAQKLQMNQRIVALEKTIRQLTLRNRLVHAGTRILYLLAATVATISFYQFGIITTTQGLLVLPIILLFLLLFPIDRIRNLAAKHPSIETVVEVDSEGENSSTQ